MSAKWLTAGLAMLLVGSPVLFQGAVAQDEPRDEPKGEAREKDDEAKGAPKGERKERAKVKRYDEVITKEAKSDLGLFIVHRIDDKLFYEIPTEVFGKELLWVTQLERTQSGHGYGGSPIGNRVVRWEVRGEDILLRSVNYAIRAEADDPIKDAVVATSLEPIIEVFPIRAYGKDKAPVIDATSLFTADLTEFSAKRRLNATGADPKRTFIEKVKSFPENIETKVILTYRLAGGGRPGGGRPGPTPPVRPDSGSDGGAVTVMLHHSMVKLPERKMKPRKYDDRIGYFTESFEDYGNFKNHQVEDVRYITRWRLEKKDPKAAVSEPKQPIVFYVGREVPSRWRPWVKKGIEMWRPAFELAGYKDAIVAKDPPSPLEDADWDPEDARYSSIRWLPSTVENAMGPHVHDPRTGEILDSDIQMYHNVTKLARDWYFVQASPNDPRAQKLPMPDELIGELVAYVVAHEVGHTLGFRHNMKASSSYTVEQLRDPKFTAENGTEASIMDYGRFNYVAQPGDGAKLIPSIGPYDRFAVEWGYKEFPDAKTYEEEKVHLDAIAARQVGDPKLRFGDPNPGEDPSQQTEDLGSDPIAATALGLKNIDRVAGYLVEATSKKGEDYQLLRNMYDELVNQRNRELMHVANVVGGVVRNNVYFGDGDRVYDPIASDPQREAVAFLNANAFQTPATLITPEILSRLESHGAADRIVSSQKSILRALLGEARIKRMSEHTARDPEAAYTPVALFDDLHSGIWGELKDTSTGVDLYRRNLQRAHVEILISNIEETKPAASDLPALCRGELKRLLGEIDVYLSGHDKDDDRTAHLHLEDLKARISQALDPHYRPAPAAAPSPRVAGESIGN